MLFIAQFTISSRHNLRQRWGSQHELLNKATAVRCTKPHTFWRASLMVKACIGGKAVQCCILLCSGSKQWLIAASYAYVTLPHVRSPPQADQAAWIWRAWNESVMAMRTGEQASMTSCAVVTDCCCVRIEQHCLCMSPEESPLV